VALQAAAQVEFKILLQISRQVELKAVRGMEEHA
jgi:hypothetical protein